MLCGFIQEEWVFVQTPTILDEIDSIFVEEMEDRSCFAKCFYLHDGTETATGTVKLDLHFGELDSCTFHLQEKVNLLPFIPKVSHPNCLRSGRLVRIFTAPDGTRGQLTYFQNEFFVKGKDHGLYNVEL